ncbi:MAG: hypothetical protein H6922_02380 [Pseudomonadaceae bacterium]|nr:hypothetical protein [Pseudomonadaceae bacterium]
MGTVNATLQAFAPPLATTLPEPDRYLRYLWAFAPHFKLSLPDKSIWPMPVYTSHIAMREYRLWLAGIKSTGVEIDPQGYPEGVEIVNVPTTDGISKYILRGPRQQQTRSTLPLHWRERNDKSLPAKTGKLHLVRTPDAWLAHHLVFTDTPAAR